MSHDLHSVAQMINRLKLAEAVAHSSDSGRGATVNALLQRQHFAELFNLSSQLSIEENSKLLEALPLEDAVILWQQIPDSRQNEVLWELTDERREQLAGAREPAFKESQMNAFVLVEGKLRQMPISSRKDFDSVKPLWIDLLGSTKAERSYIGTHFGLELPNPLDINELEVTSRFHIEDTGEIHLHSNFLLDREGNARCVPVTFVIHQGILFTLRTEDLPVFRLQRRRAQTQPGYVTDCYDLVIDLYGADVEYSADSLEQIYATLGKVGKQVLSETISDGEAAAILGDIAEEEDLNGQIRGNILDTQRAIHYLMRSRALNPSQVEDARQILTNIDSLNSHTAFLFDKINFLLDATIGFININQNKRINKLTVFGVVFMPINILAGMGGMSEFSMMTQGIPWPIAYGYFSVAMVLIGVCTYASLKYFESQGRLKKPTAKA